MNRFKWVQVVQRNLDEVEILNVGRRKASSEEMKEINDWIRAKMGDQCVVHWERVECSPLTPHGRLRDTSAEVASSDG